jgi:hypothetical protein
MLLIGTKKPLSIDYRRFVKRFNQPNVRRDLALAGVADADHLLSFFQFDEATYHQFVEGVRPVDDDRTVLDFSMPRYLGSGFGLGQFNRTVQSDGLIPFSIVAQRRQYYREIVRPVAPLLTNLGDQPREAIAARIAQRLGLRVEHLPIDEKNWAGAQARALSN